MVRKLFLILVVSLLSSPMAVYALGLGNITLHSALGQPLDATIGLIGVNPGEIQDIRVGLASNQVFREAGIEKPFILYELHFSVAKKPDGQPYIKVASKEPIREAFLNFLVQVDWPKGRVVREYTVLISPPSTPVPGVTPLASPAPLSQTAIAPAPAPAAPAGGKAQAGAAAAAAGSYGPTKPAETLWAIASRMRPGKSISVEQVMLALLKSNPQAFYGNNINRLKVGQVLRVPPQDEMTRISKQQAARIVQKQYALWRAYRSALTAAAASGHAGVPLASAAGPSKPAAPPRSAGQAQQAPQAQLKLVAPEAVTSKTQGKTPGAGSIAGSQQQSLKKQLELATEGAAVKGEENKQLRARVTTLEDQITKMKQLLTLKDSQLANLQRQLQQAHGQAAAPAGPQATAKAPATQVQPSAKQPPAAISKPPAQGQTPAQPKPQEAPKPLVRAVKPPVAAAKPLVPAVKPAAKPAPAPESPSLIQRLLSDTSLMGMVAAVVLVLVALVWLVLRRRQMTSSGFQESILTQAPATSAAALAAAEPETAAGTTEPPAEDTSFLSDFAVSDMGAIQAQGGAADPITEADVYLAYGRYQQAEELIKEAIHKAPDRNDLKLKLLEIYFTAKNTQAFESEAETLYAALGGQDEAVWEKVVGMGRQLLPDNPLFRSAQTETDAPATAPSIQMTDMDLEKAFAALEQPGEGAAERSDTGELPEAFEFDTGFKETAGEESPEAPAASRAFDFDLEPAAQEPAAERTGAGVDFSSQTFDFTPAQEPMQTMEPASTTEVHRTAGAMPDDSEKHKIMDGGLYAEGDEVGTKLDLARAYLDMGDQEGARELLTEVLEEGSDGQREEAEGLMQQLSA